MSKISELRAKAAADRARQFQRIQQVVSETVRADSSILSTINNMQGSESTKQANEFATKVASAVVDSVTNPVAAFTDVLANKGLTERKVRKLVAKFCEVLYLVEERDADETDEQYYQRQLEAVALYFEQNPKMYEDINLYT